MAETLSTPTDLLYWRRPLARPMRLIVSRTDRVRIALAFAQVYVFMAILGKLVFVPGIKNFKGYYLVLPIGFLTLTILGTKATWKALLICLPFTLYLLFSGFTANLEAISQSYTKMGIRYAAGKHSPHLAAIMMTAASLFIIVTASHIKNASAQAKVRLVEVFLTGYLVTLFVGYTFLFGRLAGVLSFSFINTFNPGGLLHDRRFAPGSDPNEYGVFSGFALTVMLLYLFCGMGRRQPRTFFTILLGNPLLQCAWVPLSLVALCFTNTRSAILALPIYGFWMLIRVVGPHLRRPHITTRCISCVLIFVIGLAVVAVAAPIAFSTIDHLKLLAARFREIEEGGGGSEGRLIMWRESLIRFEAIPLFGAGYSLHEFIHNTYIQLLCDLGIIGVALLIGTGAFVVGAFRDGLRQSVTSAEDRFLMYVREIGIVTALWFALTGHNFDIFLTWFTVLLVLSGGSRVASQTSSLSLG